MVVSRSLRCRSGLRLRVLGLDGREDLSHPCTAFHALALLLAVEQLLNIRQALQRPTSPFQDQRQDEPPLSPAAQARLKEALRTRRD